MAGLVYLCFGIVAFLLFFYITFPFHLIQEKVIQTFEAGTNCQTDVGVQKKKFPLSLIWEDIRVVCPVGTPFMVASLQTDIALKPLLFHQTGEIPFRVRLAEKNGEISGTLRVHSTPQGLSFSLKEKGSGLNLAAIGYAGIISMDGEGTWIGNHPFFGKGSLTFALNGLRIDPQGHGNQSGWVATLAGMAPLMGVTSLSFPSIQGELVWQDKVITVNKFQAESELADLISNNGSLIFNEPISESFIATDLQIFPKGNLKQMLPLIVPHYSDKGPLTLAITGTLTAPRVIMNGMQLPAMS